MEIYIFDDKPSNIEAAKAAIEAVGHTVARLSSAAPKGRNAEKLAVEKDYLKAETLSMLLCNEIKWAVREMAERGGGIITDLMFHNGPNHLDRAQPPAGLLVALHAVSAGVPVVICTDASEVGGHHGEQISWIHDGYVKWFSRTPCPFGWVDTKDWTSAIQLLVETQAKKGAEGNGAG